MSISIDRVYRIAKLAEIPIEKALDLLVDRDWTVYGAMGPGEHEAWLEDWIWAVIDNERAFG